MVHARVPDDGEPGPGHRRPRPPRRFRLRRPTEGYEYAFLLAAVLMIGALLGLMIGDPPGPARGDGAAGPPDPIGAVPPPASPTFAPSPSPSPSRKAGPPSRGGRSKPPAVPDGVRITSPRSGDRVRGSEGVRITGTAGGLGDRRLRLFDYADNDLFYLIDGGGIEVRDGRWSLRYRGIGEGRQDVGKTFVLLAVSADDGCQRVLERAEPNNEGDRPFERLPDGCRIEDRAPVVKVAP